jgi:cyclopropane-fatty-acyl-phospholipid synthase
VAGGAIAHHYDLSNDLYRLLLDEHMAYSSAYFTHAGQSLYDAQTAKLDLICRKLDLKPSQRLLDVGCGWGSLMLHAARHWRRQARSTRSRPSRWANTSASSSIRPTSASCPGDSSRPAGCCCSRCPAEPMPHRARCLYRGLHRPDMHMRPLWQTLRFLQDTGFEVRDVEAMREHYVRTVEHWIATFEDHYDQFVTLLGEQVARVWRLYLVGGALAFEEGRMGVDQVLAVKPTDRGVSAIPGTRNRFSV